MTEPTCGAAEFLRLGGPARVPFRLCCAAALLQAAQAPDATPPPCPRRRESLVAAAVGDSEFAMSSVEVIP